jgi:heme-degrading monooxygenase HmoA
MFQAIAFHHAKPEHVDSFLEFMHKVVAGVEGSPGLIEFTCWHETGTSRLFGLSRWESPEAFQAALPKIQQFGHERDPDWSAAPDEVVTAVVA